MTQFAKPLQQVFDKYEVYDQFTKAIAEIAYNAGVKNAWGESPQEPVLFKEEQQQKKFPILDQIWFDELLVDDESPTYNLSQPDVNYLRPMLSAVASALQGDMQVLKVKEQILYQSSDKNTITGGISFSKLNRVRNDIRKLQKHQKRIDGIIKTLKYGK